MDYETEKKNQDDYYNSLKNESYKAMLNSEIQASVARDQAMKYTNQQINAAGYDTQGLNQSTNLGIQNTYQAALKNAAEAHQANMLALGQQQRAEDQALNEKYEAKNSQEFESLTALMSGAEDAESLNEILGKYGINPNAKITLEDGTETTGWQYGAGSEFLTDNDKRQLEILYSLQSKGYTDGSSIRPENLGNMTYLNPDNGFVRNFGEWFEEETKVLQHKATNGDIETGGVVKVTSGQGGTVYVQWDGKGFKFVTSKEYDAATGKQYDLHYEGGKNRKDVWTKI